MFVNGSLVAQIVNVGANQTAQNLLFAGGLEFSSPAYGYNELAFNGKLDQIATWNRALSASEISDIYNGGDGVAHSGMPVSLTNGMHQCFEFPSPVGIDVADRGTIAGFLTWQWDTNRTFEDLANHDGTSYTGERVSGTTPRLSVTGPNDYSNFPFSQPGGKVSANAFTPAWVDTGDSHGIDPATGSPWESDALALAYSPHQGRKAILEVDNSVINPTMASDEYSISFWLSRRGLPMGRHVWNKLLKLAGSPGPSSVFAGYENINNGTISVNIRPRSAEEDPSFWAWNL